MRTLESGASLSSSFVVAKMRAIAEAPRRQNRLVLLDQTQSPRNKAVSLIASRLSPG